MSTSAHEAGSEATRAEAARLFTPNRIATCWANALALWETELSLSPPEPLRAGDARWGSAEEPLAYIDLVRRQVVVNYPLLVEVGAAPSLTAVLAHEVGHHLRFPHTLGLSAGLRVLEQQLIPALPFSLTNLFFDLLVNQVVGQTHAPELAAVYRGFTSRAVSRPSPLFHYYLAIYEELWGLSVGDLTGVGAAAAIEARFPGYRADARMFAQTFFALPEIHLQFIYFCSRALRYLDPVADSTAARMPLSGDVPDPSLDDYSGALGGYGALDRAIEEASKRGWIEAPVDRSDNAALSAMNRILARRPGSERKAFSQVVVGDLYRRLANRHLVRLPDSVREIPEPVLPTVAAAWEAGDSFRTIDWTLSVLTQGPMAGLHPLRRELEPDAPPTAERASTAIEIYLDTSGSMPDPNVAVNAMTLAAQIVSAAALRKGGKVKALVYSIQCEESAWLSSEEHARTFLLRYSGGGTAFPFDRFEALAQQDPGVVRVIISDYDFLANLQAKGSRERFSRGLDRSHRVVALLALPGHPRVVLDQALGPSQRHPRLAVGIVANPADLPQAAAQLTRALWGS